MLAWVKAISLVFVVAVLFSVWLFVVMAGGAWARRTFGFNPLGVFVCMLPLTIPVGAAAAFELAKHFRKQRA